MFPCTNETKSTCAFCIGSMINKSYLECAALTLSFIATPDIPRVHDGITPRVMLHYWGRRALSLNTISTLKNRAQYKGTVNYNLLQLYYIYASVECGMSVLEILNIINSMIHEVRTADSPPTWMECLKAMPWQSTHSSAVESRRTSVSSNSSEEEEEVALAMVTMSTPVWAATPVVAINSDEDVEKSGVITVAV